MVERWYVRGIRGAITVKENSAREIFNATVELLQELMKENGVEIEDIASIFFTTTPDLNAEFPALAARELGWKYVPLLCAREIDVPKAMSGVIRVLMHVNTTKKQDEIKHLYLRDATKLRPDL
ncbi:MAG: chorismate mutase [Thermincola ferriacetica]